MRNNILNLGELEKLVLQYLWECESGDVKQVHSHFKSTRTSSINTIQSTLERLYKKKLLSRVKTGHAYTYQPIVDKQDLIAKLIKSVTRDFEPDENGLVAAFSSLSKEFNATQLDKLESMIEKQRQNLNQGEIND